MLLKLKPHQIETLKYGVANPYSIFALGMRTGKSVVTLALHEKLKQNTLVVCPAYLSLNWEKEVTKCLGKKVKPYVITKGSQIEKAPLNKTDLIIISYNLAMKADRLFEWADTVALDEAHNLKSMEAKRTQAIHRLVYEYSIKNLYCLTGTPIRNRVKEYYSLIALMNYSPQLKSSPFLDRFPTDIDFANYFSYPRTFYLEVGHRTIPITNWTGIKNTEELRGYLKGKYIRFSTEEVIPSNQVDYADILIQEKADEGLLADFQKYFEDEEVSSVRSEFKLLAAIEKTKFTIKYIEGLLEEVDQVVVYSDHVEPARIIAEHFETTAIDGGVPQRIRDNIKARFIEGKTKVIVATIKSFSEGIDLSVANNLVYNDYSWVPGELAQADMRVQGYNQTKPVTIHRILGSPQDEAILRTIDAKKSVISKIV